MILGFLNYGLFVRDLRLSLGKTIVLVFKSTGVLIADLGVALEDKFPVKRLVLLI